MKLENQVCSLELSKRLKELGVPQKTVLHWLNIQHCVHMKVKEDGYTLQEDENGNPIIDKIDCRIELGNPWAHNIDKDNCWSALTVAELYEIIFEKNYEYLEQMGYLNIITEMVDRSGGYFYRITNNLTDHIIDELNQADALAKLFIYLFENRLMELSNET